MKDKESLAESAKSELEGSAKVELDAKEERHVRELERVSAQADAADVNTCDECGVFNHRYRMFYCGRSKLIDSYFVCNSKNNATKAFKLW